MKVVTLEGGVEFTADACKDIIETTTDDPPLTKKRSE